MREIGDKTMEKRGCAYCTEHKRKNKKNWCMHEACPYQELNDVKNFKEYLRKF